MALSELDIPVPPNAEVKFTRFDRIKPNELARKQLQDRQDQYKGHTARMSWQDIGRIPPKDDLKSVGRVDKNYPYSLVEGRFYIQNCKAYLGNGLTQIDPYTYDFCPGDSFEAERLRARVLDAFTSYNSAALDEDPLLCPYCLQFHAQSPLEFADHIVKVHADKYGQHLGYGQDVAQPPAPIEKPEAVPQAPPPATFMPPVSKEYVATSSTPVSTVTDATGHPIAMRRERPPLDLTPLVCIQPCNCGRTFQGMPALKRHITAFNKRRGA